MPLPVDLSEHLPVPSPERRSFLAFLLTSVGGLVSAALAIPLLRFATYPLRAPIGDTSWSDVGKLADFVSLPGPVARTVDVKRIDGWRSSVVQNGVYVVPTGNGKLKVLSSVCPHLGCAVRWIDNQDKFVCPCHGGTFTDAGGRVSGPPLRGLDELESKVDNGVLKVRFQYFRQLDAEKEAVS
jgi:menaquinol-cytochrome c reductase iron-sulfur subunit